MLARDIYRDLYEESGPTTAEKLMLAGKRLGIVAACGALTLGVLDFAGIHSLPGSSYIQSARVKIMGGSEPIPHLSSKAPVHSEVIRVAIPKTAPVKRTGTGSSSIDSVAAASRKDAISIAMTSPTLTVPAPIKAASAPIAATAPVAIAASTNSIMSSAAALTPVVTAPAKPAPATTLADVKTQTPIQLAKPEMQLSDVAARSQASVPPAAQIQLASLPTQDSPPDLSAPANAPVTESTVALIPLDKVPLPRPMPPLSPADRLNLKGKDYARAERCLANAIYFEARSEPIRGQMAVAQVVINRAFSGFYPNDVCGVVYQNAHRHLSCQFTFACDGKSKAITDRRHWAVANRIARQTLDGQIYVPEVGKSTHYHAAYVRPNWVREMRKLVRYGLHSFYRPYAWGNGNEEPVWGPADSARVHKTASR